MRTEDYWDLLHDWNDSGEPGVIIELTTGRLISGIARNEGYPHEGLTSRRTAIVSIGDSGEQDIAVDISKIVSLQHDMG